MNDFRTDYYGGVVLPLQLVPRLQQLLVCRDHPARLRVRPFQILDGVLGLLIQQIRVRLGLAQHVAHRRHLPHEILAPLDGLALEVAPQIPPILRRVAHALALPQVGDDVHGLVELRILHVDGQQTLYLPSDGLGGRARRLLAALDGPDERVRRRDLGEGGGVHFLLGTPPRRNLSEPEPLQLGVAALCV